MQINDSYLDLARAEHKNRIRHAERDGQIAMWIREERAARRAERRTRRHTTWNDRTYTRS